MLFEKINRRNILKIVRENVGKAKKEIFVTMLLREELKNPLPLSYFSLLKNKVDEGVFLRRLGFGSREEYATISRKIGTLGKNYSFRFIENLSIYQRLIIVDKRMLLFKIEDLFFTSVNKLILRAFLEYFYTNFKKAKI